MLHKSKDITLTISLPCRGTRILIFVMPGPSFYMWYDLYNHWYDLYSSWCNIFTCKNVLYTFWCNAYTNWYTVCTLVLKGLGIMRKSWQVFHDWSLLLRSFWSFVLLVLEYCSAVWCSAANLHLKLLDRVVKSAGFLAGGVIECKLAHCRSVAELCMLFKITSNPMHPLSSNRGALVPHRHSFVPPRCRTSQYRRTFVPLSVSLWNNLSHPVFDGVGQVSFKSRTNAVLLTWSFFLSPTVL